MINDCWHCTVKAWVKGKYAAVVAWCKRVRDDVHYWLGGE